MSETAKRIWAARGMYTVQPDNRWPSPEPYIRLDLHEAEVAKLRAERDALRAAGDRLSVCAQTTGGTAGRDDGLVDAITGWKEARQALKGHNQ